MDEPVRDIPKFPSMPHVPWSPEDVREQDYLSNRKFESGPLAEQHVIATEKLDGSNVRLTRENVHSRSREDPKHDSYNYLKAQHSEFAHHIPEHIILYGEWLYAVHSITYTDLSDYLYVFAAFDTEQMQWLDWDATKKYADKIGKQTPPVLREYPDGVDERPDPHGESEFGPTREGFVFRTVDGFPYGEFDRRVAKCVRENHVQTDEHWKFTKIETNGLED